MTILDADLYIYRGKAERVVDGDTVDILVDLGFQTYRVIRFRLADIDTPERGQDGYDRAAADLAAMVVGHDLLINSMKDAGGGFGRYLARIVRVHDGLDVSEAMLGKGWQRWAG